MKKILIKIVLFLLLLGASFSVCYWAIAKYDYPSDYRSCGRDVENYVKMSRMEYRDVPRPYRYRVLMPSTVYLLNRYLNIDNFLSRYYEDVQRKKIQLNFGIVNSLGLALTGLLLFYYCRLLGLASAESLLAPFLYLTSFFTVNYFSVPLVDSLSAFFMLASFYALLKGSLPLLGVSFLLGVFTKESTFAILALILLQKRRLFSRELLVCLPAVILYVIFIRFFGNSSGDNIFSILGDPARFRDFLASYLKNFNFYFLIEAVETFMFLWVLALYALLKCKVPVFIKHSLWLFILPLAAAPVVGVPFVGRVTFYLFPVVIPLALFALREIVFKEDVLQN